MNKFIAWIRNTNGPLTAVTVKASCLRDAEQYATALVALTERCNPSDLDVWKLRQV